MRVGAQPIRADALLDIRGLGVEYRSADSSAVPALLDVSFAIHDQEILGVLGESGSGKTTLALSLLDLLPQDIAYSTGRVEARLTDSGVSTSLKRLRGHTIAAIFQEPGTSLNPIMQVGKQVAEVLHVHKKWSWKRCMADAKTTMAELFKEEVDRVFSSFPHQLSGGQRQRVLIAQALVCKPTLLVADEPTASLDSTVQMEILGLLKRLVQEHHMSLLLISHDPRVLKMMASRVMVMYAGRIVEQGLADEVFHHPKHPYTEALLRLAPQRNDQRVARGTPLATIAGSAPNLAILRPGCAFYERCDVRMEECRTQEPVSVAQGTHAVRCFKYGR